MFNLFRKKQPSLSQDQLAILNLHDQIKALQDHLIALARLQFVKPETLVREAKNINGNGEYLLKMVECSKPPKENKP